MEEKVGTQNLKSPKTFSDYSQATDYAYENFDDYNSTKKRGVLIAFYFMIVDMEPYKKVSPIVTEFLLRKRKRNISLAFISQCYSKVPKL